MIERVGSNRQIFSDGPTVSPVPRSLSGPTDEDFDRVPRDLRRAEARSFLGVVEDHSKLWSWMQTRSDLSQFRRVEAGPTWIVFLDSVQGDLAKKRVVIQGIQLHL